MRQKLLNKESNKKSHPQIIAEYYVLPKIRYIKNTNNLRDLYIRSLKLGGQKEWLYNNSDRNDIGYSFYNAWEDKFDDN